MLATAGKPSRARRPIKALPPPPMGGTVA